MKIGIIGSGQVALTLAEKLLALKHSVMISSRNLNKEKDRGNWGVVPSPNDWLADQKKNKRKASAGSFEQAADFGKVLINCTAGSGSLAALRSAGKSTLAGKILIDVSNPLDFSKGMPPTLLFCNTTSLGEQIQEAFPKTKVVKALNTINAQLMVKPSLVRGKHDLFIAGNDDKAKRWVRNTLLKKWFGWKTVHDLGDITAARATEMYLPLWLRLMSSLDTPMFNVRVVK